MTAVGTSRALPPKPFPNTAANLARKNHAPPGTELRSMSSLVSVGRRGFYMPGCEHPLWMHGGAAAALSDSG